MLQLFSQCRIWVHLIRIRSSIAQGLADYKRVTVLDFACGTGTFILEVLERIFDHTGGADSAKASLIAHLKLSQYLADKGRALGDGLRLQVFLTNTLEPQRRGGGEQRVIVQHVNVNEGGQAIVGAVNHPGGSEK